MNRAEALVDRLDPRVSVRLRLLKKRWRRDLVLRIIDALVRPGDVAVDIGANRGVYTLALSRRVGAQGRVHSFDPVPVNGRSLERLGRSLGNVTVHPVALSDSVGTADLHVPVHGRPVDALARLGPPPPGMHATQPVAVRTLDDVLAGEGAPPAFVKCDVEGHEQHVLDGGRALFTNHLPTFVVEIEQRHRADDVIRTIDELLGWGYRGYGLAGGTLKPISEFDLDRDQLQFTSGPALAPGRRDGYVGNFLFVRPGLELGPLAPR